LTTKRELYDDLRSCITCFSQSADNLKVHLRILRSVQGNPAAKNWSLEEDCFIDATSCVG